MFQKVESKLMIILKEASKALTASCRSWIFSINEFYFDVFHGLPLIQIEKKKLNKIYSSFGSFMEHTLNIWPFITRHTLEQIT